MKEKLGLWIRKNEKIHCILKAFHQLNRAEFRRYVLDYRIGIADEGLTMPDSFRRETSSGSLHLDVYENGLFDPGKMIYVITIKSASFGMCSQLTVMMNRLNFADRLGMIPCIKWCESDLYQEKEPVQGTRNVFEYYFEPVCGITDYKAETGRFVVYDDLDAHYGFDWIHIPMVDRDYQYTEADLERYADLMNQYIRLRPEIEQQFLDEREALFQGKKVLGVHGRGGDMKLAFLSHPLCVTSVEYIEETDKAMQEIGAELIFLATDDNEILEAFWQHFQDWVVYYDDVIRTSGRLHNCLVETDRPLHRYKLGLEILRDVYTLASCDGLITGVSYVNCVVRFIKKSFHKNFEFLKTINKGRHKHGKNVNDPQFLTDNVDLIKKLREAQLGDGEISQKEKQEKIERILSDFYDS